MIFEMNAGEEMPEKEDIRTVEERLNDIEKSIRALSRQLAAVAHMSDGSRGYPLANSTRYEAFGYSPEEIRDLVKKADAQACQRRY